MISRGAGWTAVSTVLLFASCNRATPVSRVDDRASPPQAAVPTPDAPTTKGPANVDPSKASSPVAADHPRQKFLQRLAAVSRGIVATLTPAAVSEIFSVPVHASSATGWFELTTTDGEPRVQMQASSAQAPIAWIEFESVRSLGVTLADLESIYGTKHHALPPAKDGTTVVFDMDTAPVARSAYVSAQLWSPSTRPDSQVSQIQLRYPR